MRNPQPECELDILILGPIPPPFGGVSVHLSRFVPLLKNAGFRVAVLNHFDSTEMCFVVGALKRNPVNYYRLPKRFSARVVHYHHSHWATLMAVAIGKRNGKSRYVLTLHSHDIRDQLNSRVPLLARATEWALQRFDAIIVVNPKIEAAIKGHMDARRVFVLPAFLEASQDRSQYDASVEAFLESGSTLIVPAYRVQFIRGGRDMYGLDTAVEAFATLALERPELKLALFLAERSASRRAVNHLASLRRRLEELNLTGRVLIVFGLPLVPALRPGVVVVRPTRTEGDALSIREALHAGVPVVASDVVERPTGCVTFPAEDIEELCAALRRVLDVSIKSVAEGRDRKADETSASSFFEGVMHVYRDQLAPGASEGASLTSS